ncbi:MAG: hypothetical protein WC924_00070 [Candidatus Gracilibacteria bacterium]
MPKKLENRLFLLCAALVLTFNGLFYALAAETETDTDTETVSTVTDGVDYACGNSMMQDAAVVIDSYQVFLDDYFKAVTPSSEQVESGMRYYRFVEDSIESIYKKYADVQGNSTLEASASALSYCASIRDQYLSLARVLFQKQVIASANSKRTFLIIDGLKATNEHLDQFSNEFNALFPAYFDQLNNALPCYAHQCITK